MPFGERYIWGVTAGILRNLYERIYVRSSMIRPVLTELALFLAPFVALCGLSVGDARPACCTRNPGRCRRWRWLTIAALALMIGSFIVLAQWGGEPPGSTYVPAHMEDGKFVPGQTK